MWAAQACIYRRAKAIARNPVCMLYAAGLLTQEPPVRMHMDFLPCLPSFPVALSGKKIPLQRRDRARITLASPAPPGKKSGAENQHI